MLTPRRFIGLILAAMATALVALLLTSSEVSPSPSTVQATIQPDTGTGKKPCPVPAEGKLRSDAECDLTIRLINNSTTTSTFSISESGAANALDESTFAPSASGKSKLSECPL